jgi:hypothetical protein
LQQPGTADGQQQFAEQAAKAGSGRHVALGVDARVDVLAIEIGGLVRGRDLHVDARMQRVERRRGAARASGSRTSAAASGAAGCPSGSSALPRREVDLVERAVDRPEVRGTLRGEGDAALRSR